ncbi:hypothetical protein [Mucilaginibacter agri]|uniref:Uncharacterized protein n=1 Tax=Mucilaginibacter agri TaxID=2695265 RepID=A0A966DWR5_9SPHI|nr:hypothetical protein [Mucilaginibacter agri]NCD71619.1 hypothetical protein [Mucilaginibacter agri]
MKNIDIVKKGDWIFTCVMTPLQFSHFETRNPNDYDQEYLNSLDSEAYSNFLNDSFETTDGSSHSFKNCGCKVISEAYAKWFIQNNIHLMFDKYENYDNKWDLYTYDVRQASMAAGLPFEGL